MPTLFVVPSTDQACEVDEDVYEWAIERHWFTKTGGYVYRWENIGVGEYREVALHREIMGVSDIPGHEVEVHHWDENPLNNRRANLEVMTPKQHHRLHLGDPETIAVAQWPRPAQSNNTSGFKGVTWHRTVRRWMAQILRDGRNYVIGYFDDPEEAALAYDAAVLAFRGEGYLNLLEPAAAPSAAPGVEE